MQTKNRPVKRKLSGYSLIEILVTLVIFGILSAMLGQSLLSNLTLSAKISARTQIRSSIDQSLSLIERDFRNTDWLTSTSECGGATVYAGCAASCSMNINGKIVVWCFQAPYMSDGSASNPKSDKYVNGKLTRLENGTTGFETDKILDIMKLDFSINNSQADTATNNVAYANILVTLQAQNARLNIFNQVKQISITTRNYSIK